MLTAFLAISIPSLSPDDAQTAMQINALAALPNAPPDKQPFLNATAQALPTSADFQPETSAVVVNALWFISRLVLSLAAALFGIHAKQWCREYLRWHSVVDSARLNVMLRQLRYEAARVDEMESRIAHFRHSNTP